MRWNLPKEDKVGDRKLFSKFAWLPVKVQDKEIWLETYWIEKRFEVRHPMGNTFGKRLRKAPEWIRVNEYLWENKPKPKTENNKSTNWMDM